MEQHEVCKYCGTQTEITAFFCPTCGKKLKDKPLSTGWGAQAGLYLASLLLPPLNLPWTIKYIKSNEATAKKIGWISVGVMTIGLVLAFVLVNGWVKSLTTQVNETMGQYSALGF